MSTHRKRNTIIIVGLALSLGFPVLPISKWINEFADVWHLVFYEIIWWTAVVMILVYIRYVERKPFTSIKFFTPSPRDVLISFLWAVISILCLASIYFVVFPALHWDEETEINQLLATPFWWRFISTIRAAVSEEVFYRGYGIERLHDLTGNRTLAAIISCFIFALAHVGPWGWGHIIVAGIGGTIFTSLYLWKGNLWVNIICHFIVDAVAVLA